MNNLTRILHDFLNREEDRELEIVFNRKDNTIGIICRENVNDSACYPYRQDYSLNQIVESLGTGDYLLDMLEELIWIYENDLKRTKEFNTLSSRDTNQCPACGQQIPRPLSDLVGHMETEHKLSYIEAEILVRRISENV